MTFEGHLPFSSADASRGHALRADGRRAVLHVSADHTGLPPGEARRVGNVVVLLIAGAAASPSSMRADRHWRAIRRGHLRLRADVDGLGLAFDALLEDGVAAHEARHAIGRRLVEELVAEFGLPPAPAPRARGDRRVRERRRAERAARSRNRR